VIAYINHSCVCVCCVLSFSLSGVIRVNPFDAHQVADSIESALSMSLKQRKEMHHHRFQYVMKRNTIGEWTVSFLRHLEQSTLYNQDVNFIKVGWGNSARLVALQPNFKQVDASQLAPFYVSSQRRIFLLDYDGTLVNSKYTQSQAQESVQNKPPARLLGILRLLTEDPRNIVMIISGRDRHQLHAWFADLPELGLVAEQGCFIRWPASISDLCRESPAPASTQGRSKQFRSPSVAAESKEEEARIRSVGTFVCMCVSVFVCLCVRVYGG
jgi:hypothetical protein